MKRNLGIAVAVVLVCGTLPWESWQSLRGGEKVGVQDLPELLRVTWPEGHTFRPLAFSPDSKQFACAVVPLSKSALEGGVIHIYEIATKKLIHQLRRPRDYSVPESAVFSPAGDMLAVSYLNDIVGVWHLKTEKFVGQERHEKEKKFYTGFPVFFTPDGKAFGTGSILTIDPDNGKAISRFDGIDPQSNITAFYFSKDGKFVVTEETKPIDLVSKDFGVFLETRRISGNIRDLASSKVIGAIGKPLENRWLVGSGTHSPEGNHDSPGPLQQVGIIDHCFTYRVSPLGTFIFFACHHKDAVIEVVQGEAGDPLKICDKHSGIEIHRISDCRLWFPRRNSPDLSPDNRVLAALPRSKSPIRVLLLLDTSRVRERALETRRVPTDKEMAALFEQLGADTPLAAFRALNRLSEFPKQSVAYLAEKLKPAPDQRKTIADFIAQLNSDQFNKRQKAESELMKLGRLAEVAIKKALVKPESEEANQRLARIAKAIKDPATIDISTRRALWAIEFLERIGRPDAENVLSGLANGGPDAWITEAALVSLQAMKKATGKHK